MGLGASVQRATTSAGGQVGDAIRDSASKLAAAGLQAADQATARACFTLLKGIDNINIGTMNAVNAFNAANQTLLDNSIVAAERNLHQAQSATLRALETQSTEWRGVARQVSPTCRLCCF